MPVALLFEPTLSLLRHLALDMLFPARRDFDNRRYCFNELWDSPFSTRRGTVRHNKKPPITVVDPVELDS
jgi:hypothetical protein